MGKNRFHVNKLFVRILLYFLSLLLPIIVIGTIFYNNFIEEQKKQFMEKMSLDLKQSVSTVDNYLRTIQTLSVSFFDDEYVKQLLYPYGQASLGQKSEIYKIINRLRHAGYLTHEFADSLFVYIDTQKVYTPSTLDDFDTFFDKSYRMSGYDKSFWIQTLQGNSKFSILNVTEVSKGTGELRKVIPVFACDFIQGYKAVFAATLSVDNIVGMMKGKSAFATTEYMVLDGGGAFYFSSGDPFLSEATLRTIPSYFQDHPSPSAELAAEGTSWIVSREISSAFGWEYYSFTPAVVLEQQAEGIAAMIVWICCILFAIGLLFSFIFTYYLYNPIRKIRDVLVHQGDEAQYGGEADGSGENELIYIGQSVHQLIERNHRFERKLHAVSVEYLEHTLLNLVGGSPSPSGQELVGLLDNYLSFGKSHFVCCTVRMQFKKPFYQTIQDVDRFVILSKLKNVISGVIGQYVDANVIECKQPPNFYLCIVNIDDSLELGNHAILKAFQAVMRTFEYDSLFCSLHIGVGKAYPELKDIKRSYEDAMTAMQSIDADTDFALVDAADLNIDRSFYYSLVDEYKIAACLASGDSDKLESMLDEIVQTNKDRDVSHGMMHVLLFEMYHTGQRFAAEKGDELSRIVADGRYRELQQLNEPALDLPQKLGLLKQLFGALMEASGQSRPPRPEASQPSVVPLIMNYVQQNYRQNLYLESIADELGLSSRYVSRIFKEKTGMNLTDYIGKIRMDKAKELLMETDWNITEISEAVGITSRTTFLRLFKRFVGVAPNDFRKALSGR